MSDDSDNNQSAGQRQAAVQKHGGTVDWPALRSRLDVLRRAIETDWTPAPEQLQRTLKNRARELAQPLAGESADEQLEIIEFLLAGERYGITSEQVREVCPLLELTPVPCTPPYVLGIIDVRGEFISVIDIKKYFELSGQGLSDLNKVIILHSQSMTFGILVDVIVEVRYIAKAELQAPLPTLAAIRAEYLLGITADHLAIIDEAKLLADRTLLVNEEVAL